MNRRGGARHPAHGLRGAPEQLGSCPRGAAQLAPSGGASRASSATRRPTRTLTPRRRRRRRQTRTRTQTWTGQIYAAPRAIPSGRSGGPDRTAAPRGVGVPVCATTRRNAVQTRQCSAKVDGPSRAGLGRGVDVLMDLLKTRRRGDRSSRAAAAPRLHHCLFQLPLLATPSLIRCWTGRLLIAVGPG